MFFKRKDKTTSSSALKKLSVFSYKMVISFDFFAYYISAFVSI